LNSLEPVKEMHDALLWAAQYYRVGLMSNIMAGQIKAMINRGVLPNIPYEAIADSSELGAIKPEAAMYKKAAELGKVKPQEILLIDDNRTNLMAAEQMGWHVLWFDDYRPGETETQIKQTLEF
jgi:FMN phosphatase YigB (HAD superfamily)